MKRLDVIAGLQAVKNSSDADVVYGAKALLARLRKYKLKGKTLEIQPVDGDGPRTYPPAAARRRRSRRLWRCGAWA